MTSQKIPVKDMPIVVPKLVSIIMPAFNSAETIERAISSVVAQTYACWELIVIDDASSDNTVSIVEGLARKDSRIRLVRNAMAKGAAGARNTGILEANGTLLSFLDSDDTWDEDFLNLQTTFIEGAGTPVVTASYRRHYEDMPAGPEDCYIVPERITYARTLYSCALSCLTTVVNLEIVGKRLMPIEAGKREDLAYYLGILKDFGPARGNPHVCATYYIRSNSVSRNKVEMARYQWQVYRRIEHLPVVQAAALLGMWAVAGTIKYLRRTPA
jgi:glycosyltransferase involved in cell wall biosynthesis